MGRINEYQRKQLVSRAVGVAPVDQSGQIIGGAVAKLGNTVIQAGLLLDKKQKAVDKVYDDLAVNNSLLKWNAGAVTIEAQLKNQYAGDPKGYSDALAEKLQESASIDAESIQSDTVKLGFLKASSSAIGILGRQGAAWEVAKRQENALTDVTEGLDSTVVAVGNGTSSLAAGMQAANDTIVLAEGLDLDGMGLDSGVLAKTQAVYNTALMNAKLSYELENNSYGLLRDLKQGVYDDMIVETSSGKIRVPLTDKVKKDYEKKAAAVSTQQEYKRLLDQVIKAEGSSQQYTEALFKGEIGVAGISQEVERAKFIGASSAYIDNMEALLSVAASRAALEAKADDPMVVGPIQAELFALSGEINDVKKVIKKRPGSDKARKNSAALTTELLEIRTRAARAHAAGSMTRGAWVSIEKTIAPILNLGILSQVGASQDQGKTWFGYRDDLGNQYAKINSVINGMTNLSATQKEGAIVRAANYFMGNIVTMQNMSPENELTSAQYDTARAKAIVQVQDIYAPEYIGLKVGDKYLGEKITEIGDDGIPRFEVTKEIQKLKDNAN